MIYYLAGLGSGWMEAVMKAATPDDRPLNALMSFEWKDLAVKSFRFYEGPERIGELFIDSGAFSVFTRGSVINLDDYCSFLKTWEHIITVYATLDVIGDPDGTLRNFHLMKKQGLSPLWTFHYDPHQQMDYRRLEAILDEGERYIAFGGMAAMRGGSRELLMRHLDRCFDIIHRYWPVKVHGFGIGNIRLLKRYPFYSVDASSWVDGSRHKQVMQLSLAPDIRRNLPPRKWTKGMLDSYMERVMFNIRQVIAFEKELTDLWKERGITWTN